jgi:hypothetical protein
MVMVMSALSATAEPTKAEQAIELIRELEAEGDNAVAQADALAEPVRNTLDVPQYRRVGRSHESNPLAPALRRYQAWRAGPIGGS